jgi:hypothetical protein
MFTLKKYISNIIVNSKTKLNATEIQSLSIIFIFLLRISKVYSEEVNRRTNNATIKRKQNKKTFNDKKETE